MKISFETERTRSTVTFTVQDGNGAVARLRVPVSKADEPNWSKVKLLQNDLGYPVETLVQACGALWCRHLV